MAYKHSGRKSTDLTMRGTAGRDCSPKSHQARSLAPPSKAPEGIEHTGTGTPMGGVPPEGKRGYTASSGVLDPATFNVDNHAIRQFSHYWEGKRSGPDWLHKRVEAADAARWNEAAAPMLKASLPKRRKL